RPRAGQAMDHHQQHRGNRGHRRLPPTRPGAGCRHRRVRPEGRACGLRRAVAHVLAAAGTARTRGQRPGAHPDPQARGADLERIAWLTAGDHARVIKTMPEYATVRPEAKFAHYLMMIGALGEEAVTAPGRPFSDYENSVGTGQMHIWFDKPADGWKARGG